MIQYRSNMPETDPQKKPTERSDKETQKVIDDAARRAISGTKIDPDSPLDEEAIRENINTKGKVFDEEKSTDSE